MLLFTALNFAFLFKYGNPDWKPLLIGYLGLAAAGGALLAIGTFISTLTKNQIIAGAATFGVCLLLWVLEWVSGYETATWAQVLSYMSVITHFESFGQGRARFQRRSFLSHRDFPGTVLHRALHGIAALEVVDGKSMAQGETNQIRSVCGHLHPGGDRGSRRRQRSRRSLQQVVRRHVEQALQPV